MSEPLGTPCINLYIEISMYRLQIKIKITNCVVLWLSKIILNFVSLENKSTFRKLENFERKKNNVQLHRELNQKCLKENLLPKYTNTYV